MADEITLQRGTKFQLAIQVEGEKEPNFNMICTFAKTIDTSAFLVSIPMQDNQPLPLNENAKLLFKYEENENVFLLAGYADDVVKEGIRRYWKIRRITQQHVVQQRADERIKVAIHLEYMQDTWPINSEGFIDKETGMSLDISAGGMALFLNRRFDVGEICHVSFPNIGLELEWQGLADVVAVACWMRETPKGSLYRMLCGFQFRFSDSADRENMKRYIAYVKKKYKL